VVNRLGNLTLLARPLNKQAKNADFATKKPFYQQSQILITKELSKYSIWNMDSINARQKASSKLVLSI
jgi:hypothetical protein